MTSQATLSKSSNRVGEQTISFPTKPAILSGASVVGPKESQGPLGRYFDSAKQDTILQQKSWELAEQKMFIEAAQLAIQKAGMAPRDIDFLFGGDLLNQIIVASSAASELSIPFVGLYGACATMAEALALAALVVDGGYASHALAIASSHHDTAERQFRYPTEFGAQQPPEAQWTATAAGAVVVADPRSPRYPGTFTQAAVPRITLATIGKVVDMGVKNPWNMGSAMAPAAVDSVWRHLKDTGRSPGDYDVILTGDLGEVGKSLLETMLKEKGVDVSGVHADAGLLIYGQDQDVGSGGSGCGCSAAVLASYMLNEMSQGNLKRLLLVATGSLHSLTSIQQGESMPCIAHALAIETL